MNTNDQPLNCFNCNRSELVIPLITIRFAGHQTWICSQCMPVLIHHTEELMGKLTTVDQQSQNTTPSISS